MVTWYDGIADSFYGNIGGGLIALAHGDIQDQFGVPLDCDEGVAVSEVLIVFGTHAL